MKQRVKKAFQSVISEACHMQSFYSRIRYWNSYVWPASNTEPEAESKHLKVESWIFDLGGCGKFVDRNLVFLFFFFTIICLTVPGLSCGIQDLLSSLWLAGS